MSKYFLGVDGGQSGTTALIGDEDGHVIGVGRAGACGHIDDDQLRAVLAAAITDASAAAGLKNPLFETAWVGLSGGVKEFVGEVIQAKAVRVTHDAAIALEGALAGEPGVIVIAGTGSIAYGRNVAGQDARAGGWGYVFGDEGGAFDIVRQALRAALRFEEGWGPRTALRNVLLLEASGAENANELMHWAYRDDYPRDRVAAWAPLVETAANAGDSVAAEILRGAAQSLAMFASAVRRQLFHEGAAAAVSYAGGVFQNERILDTFRTLVELDDSIKVTPPRYSPAAGALIGAYRLATKSVVLQGAPPIK